MKALTVILLLLCGIAADAQVFLGMNANNNGVGIQLMAESGETANVVAVSTGFNTPIISRERPNIAHLAVGMTHKFSEEDPFFITGLVGGAHVSYEDFSLYDHDYTAPIIKVQKISAYSSLAIGKQWYKGRVFLQVTHAERTSYGGGFLISF